MSEKKPKRVESLGPTGDLVRKRIEESRRARGYSFAELSRRLEEVGRPIPPLGLSRIEAGERRVDVDDLIALAFVLGVSPINLLLPHEVGLTIDVEHTAVGVHPSELVRRWLGGEPLRVVAHVSHDEMEVSSGYLVPIADELLSLTSGGPGMNLISAVEMADGWPLSLQYNRVMTARASDWISHAMKVEQALHPERTTHVVGIDSVPVDESGRPKLPDDAP